jgi:hypothetical protein
MERPILLIGGGKGGVGKSLLSVALVDYIDWRTAAASEIWPAATCPAGSPPGMGCVSCVHTRARHSDGASHGTRNRREHGHAKKLLDATDR